MTDTEIIDFLALIELEDYADVEPQDIVAALRAVEGEEFSDFLANKRYEVYCQDCSQTYLTVGEDMLDASCPYCGSVFARRK